MKNVRALAAQAIAPLLRQQGALSSTLPSALAECLDKDRALLQQLCYGVARNHPRLVALICAMIDRPLRRIEFEVQALMMVGLYQLLETRVATHAAISETVNAAEQLGHKRSAGMINAILRRFDREHTELFQQLDKDAALPWTHNHPQWFIEKLQHNWPEYWTQILHENNQQAPMFLRVNTQRVSRETYLQQLAEENISAQPCQYSDDGILLEKAVDVFQLPNFAEGFASVQDEAAQLSCQLINPQPGERILDAAAAPGGKLCHLLERCSEISAVAVEVDAQRAERINENLARLNLSADIIIADASIDAWWDGEAFDKILLDAPCSATGVIRRNPDIKMLRKGEEIHTLAALQMKILENTWQMLKPGGRLVYATCSIFSQENERLIERFVKQTDNATHHPIEAAWGEARAFGRQLFPQANGHDGFYYAVLEKQITAE